MLYLLDYLYLRIARLLIAYHTQSCDFHFLIPLHCRDCVCRMEEIVSDEQSNTEARLLMRVWSNVTPMNSDMQTNATMPHIL